MSPRFLITDEHGIENLLAWMRGHRLRKRLTQAEVAERMGCTQQRVSAIETGRVDLRMSEMRRYKQALELTGDYKLLKPGEWW